MLSARATTNTLIPVRPFSSLTKLLILLYLRTPDKIGGPRHAPARSLFSMPRPKSFTLLFVVLTALAVPACGDDEPTTPTAPTPVSITVTFDGTLTVNGAHTEHFTVQQTGSVTA